MDNKSPLRYVGGKTRACAKLNEIFNQYFIISQSQSQIQYKNLVSPFFGGGSFEFFLQNKYSVSIYANDKFTPLYNFWIKSKNTNVELCSALNALLGKITKNIFIEYRNKIIELLDGDSLLKAVYYFVINRCSFSGATLSGGFSLESSNKRFTKSSIENIKNLDLSKFTIMNCDFSDFLKSELVLNLNASDTFIFLDPPYYLEKGSKLYGNKGDMHESFDHKGLFELITNSTFKFKWMMTYNDCTYIKTLYANYKIIETDWSYGMNKSKKSSEIVIVNM